MKTQVTRLALILSLLAALNLAVPAYSQEPARQGDAFSAEASVEIIKGNSAQARQAALAVALQTAALQAALSFLGPQGKPEEVRKSLGRPEAYILSYRVLTEGKVEPVVPEPDLGAPAWPSPGPEAAAPAASLPAEPAPAMYAVRVEALIFMPALKRDLRARGLAGAEDTVLPAVAMGLSAPPQGLAADRAEALLLAALKQAGFAVRLLASGSARPEELCVMAGVKSLCAGGKCQADAVLTGKEGKAVVAETAASGTGAGAEDAAAEALKVAVAALARRLQEPAAILVRLENLAAWSELVQVKAALDDMGLPARERSLRAGQAVLEVKVAGGPGALAQRLAQREWRGFSLGAPQVAAGELILTVAHPEAAPPAP